MKIFLYTFIVITAVIIWLGRGALSLNTSLSGNVFVLVLFGGISMFLSFVVSNLIKMFLIKPTESVVVNSDSTDVQSRPNRRYVFVQIFGMVGFILGGVVSLFLFSTEGFGVFLLIPLGGIVVMIMGMISGLVVDLMRNK